MVAALLTIMASEQWFDRRGDDYHLRAEGRAVLDRIHVNRYRWLGALDLPEAGYRLERRFRDLLNLSLAAGDPPGVWCLAHSRNRAPDEDSSIAPKLFQYVADFNAFRDDCHMASWRPLSIEGYAWEAFGLASDGACPTAGALFDALAHRGYSVADYAAALDDLAGRGWVRPNGGDYTVTDSGRAVRAEVERLTDAYFYAPWSALSPAEVLEIRDDINAVHRSLQSMSTV
jgi:hypothetical protein